MLKTFVGDSSSEVTGTIPASTTEKGRSHRYPGEATHITRGRRGRTSTDDWSNRDEVDVTQDEGVGGT